MNAELSMWSHALAAALFGAIAIGQSQRNLDDRRDLAMLVALALTSFFALSVAATGPYSRLGQLAEHLKDFGWIGFMYLVWRKSETPKVRTVSWLYAVLVAVLVVQAGHDLIAAQRTGITTAEWPLAALALLRMIVSIGSLLLIHDLYRAADDQARGALRLPMIGVTLMWVYDLNLATTAWLSGGWPDELFASKGLLLCLVAPLFALAAHRQANWKIRLSRTVTLQSVNLASIGLYLVAMALIVQLLELLGGERARLAQVSFIFASLLAGLILMPSQRFKSWLRVKVSKHLFKHRYDYRLEWQRFTDTLGHAGASSAPIEERVVKALADMLEAHSGLLIADSAGGMIVEATLDWDLQHPEAPCVTPGFAAHLAANGRIIDLDAIRNGTMSADADPADRQAPQWLLDDPRAWVAVPLVHFGRLMGIVVLSHPSFSRPLDWEDFDLLRVAGRQVASYLAEANGQQELADVKQFDEFNRRFAFIMHDIKNLASQLALVARNAERHADNPEFRADMIETLKSSTTRMNDLLARLSQHNKGRKEDPRPLLAFDSCERVAAQRRMQHPVVVMGDTGIRLVADPARLEQALGQLVQNAIEASTPGEPVSIFLRDSAPMIAIDVIDKGRGMTQTFIHSELFKPFASTKETGFGVGAFEARTLISEMGGRLDVRSIEGQGSCFTIWLPSAPASSDTKSMPIQEDLAA